MFEDFETDILKYLPAWGASLFAIVYTFVHVINFFKLVYGKLKNIAMRPLVEMERRLESKIDLLTEQITIIEARGNGKKKKT